MEKACFEENNMGVDLLDKKDPDFVSNINKIAKEQAVNSHFCVSTYPFFSTSLYVVPSPYAELLNDNFSEVSIYDSSGELVNHLRIKYPVDQVGIIELDALMESCKMESGIKHAHLHIKSPFASSHYCRLQSGGKSCFLSAARKSSFNKKICLPLVFTKGIDNLLLVTNPKEEQGLFNAELHTGKKKLKLEFTIAGKASKILLLENEYPEISYYKREEQKQAYLTIKSDGLCFQLLEKHEINENKSQFVVIA